MVNYANWKCKTTSRLISPWYKAWSFALFERKKKYWSFSLLCVPHTTKNVWCNFNILYLLNMFFVLIESYAMQCVFTKIIWVCPLVKPRTTRLHWTQNSYIKDITIIHHRFSFTSQYSVRREWCTVWCCIITMAQSIFHNVYFEFNNADL